MWWALLVIMAGLALMFLLRSAPARVERLAVPEGWPKVKRTWKDHVMSKMPGWYWRGREWLLGPRPGVNIQTRFATMDRWSEVEAGLPGLGAPVLADTNGLLVWFIPSNQVTQVREALFRSAKATLFSSPHVQTADGVSAMLMTGVSGGGSGSKFSGELTAWFEPVIRHEALDLKAIFSCVSTPQPAPAGSPHAQFSTQAVGNLTWKGTNGASRVPPAIPQPDPIALRVQLREGEEMLVVQEKRAALGGRPFVILVKAAPMPKK